MGVPARAAECHLRHRDPRGQQPPGKQRSRIIAATPKPPASPARHQPRPRKRAVKPVLAEAPASPGSPRKKTIAAGPKTAAPRPRKAKTEPSRLDTMQQLIVTSLEDDKAENVVT